MYLGNRAFYAWKMEGKSKRTQCFHPFFGLCLASWSLDGVSMKNYLRKWKLSASYTVEATYIMAITLLSLSVLIRSGYTKYKKETSIMRLHHVVEQIRGQEEKEGRSLKIGEYKIEAAPSKDQIAGNLTGPRWKKNIQVKVHEPENMMRMMTVFQSEDRR